MILNRLGNKTQIAEKVQFHFPPHDIYIEPFFGAGGMFFNKPKAKFNFLNDLDEDVYNLFRVLMDKKDDFIYHLETTPISERLFKEWGKGRKEISDVMNAIRFLIISNFGLYGKVDTLRIGCVTPKKEILKHVEATLLYIKDAYFFNTDFRKVFKKIDYKSNKDRAFVYCDPPYLHTTNNYSAGFTTQDVDDLFSVLINEDVRFAYSEFDHPYLLEQADKLNLNVVEVGERKNLGNRRVEILITNFKNAPTLF